MQNLISIAIIWFSVTTCAAQESKMTESPFSIKAACRDNPQCIFDKEDILIDLFVKNEASDEIRIPLEFINQSGPYCILVDNESKKKITLRVGLPDHSKIDSYAIIRPNETIKMTRRVTAGQIYSIRLDMVDLTATLTVGGPIQFHPGEEPMKFRNDVEVRIIGRDKMERDRLL
jgi:hypothetical protein